MAKPASRPGPNSIRRQMSIYKAPRDASSSDESELELTELDVHEVESPQAGNACPVRWFFRSTLSKGLQWLEFTR